MNKGAGTMKDRPLDEAEGKEAWELRERGVPVAWIADELLCTAEEARRAIRQEMKHRADAGGTEGAG